MKKAKSEMNDWLRPSYTRADFGRLVRGKHARRAQAHSNVVLLDPRVAKVFPNDKAVNHALMEFIDIARAAAR